MLMFKAVRLEDETPEEDEILIFTSAAAVRFLVSQTKQHCGKAICVGAVTAQEAEKAGYTVILVFEAGAAEIVHYFQKNLSALMGQKFCFVRGVDVTIEIDEALRGLGLEARHLVVYAAEATQGLSPETLSAINGARLNGVTLFSTRTALIFCHMIREYNLHSLLSDVPFFCMSNGIEKTVRTFGFFKIYSSDHPRQNDVLASIQRYFA
jgi:uroporphyrinogen-III synthase